MIYLQRKLLAWTIYGIEGWYLSSLYIDDSIGLLLWRRVSKAAPWSNNLSKFHTTSREPRYPLQRYANLAHIRHSQCHKSFHRLTKVARVRGAQNG